MRGGKFGKVALVVALVIAAVVGPALVALAFGLVLGSPVWESSERGEGVWGPEEGAGGIALATTNEDDGELHDGWDDSCGYSFVQEAYEMRSDEVLEAYGRRVNVDVAVSYPQFEGAGEYTEALNELLKETAFSMTNSCYLDPSSEMVAIVSHMAAAGIEAAFIEQVDYAITYNTADFVSVSFSDSYEIGEGTGTFIALRCVNFDLRTGQSYDVGDVLMVDDEVAQGFVDTLAAYTGEDTNGDGLIADSEAWTIAIIGREAWAQGLQGEGDYAHRMVTTFFVDEEGRVNLGVTWWFNAGNGYSRGWWDMTLRGDVLEEAQQDSTLWELLPAA